MREKDLDDDGNSDFEEIASDIENTSELKEWLSTQSFTTGRLLPQESLVKKFLPPGTIMDLFEHYKATQSLLGGPSVSQHACNKTLLWYFMWVIFSRKASLTKGKTQTGACKLRYSTFLRVYQDRWKDILGFRQKTLFTTCEVCAVLKEQLSDKSMSLEQKLGSLETYRAHLHAQYTDRSILWQLQGESADPNTDILLISTDGLDQSKFSLPRDPMLKTNAALSFGLRVAKCLLF